MLERTNLSCRSNDETSRDDRSVCDNILETPERLDVDCLCGDRMEDRIVMTFLLQVRGWCF